jgi:hypothetical protein
MTLITCAGNDCQPSDIDPAAVGSKPLPDAEQLVRKLHEYERREADPLIKQIAKWREDSSRKDIVYG